uniref:Cu/Zn superoxide dismutase n=1 Tax=Tetraselmis sp. GSL018 TaxID=582737 RepID=A0A061S0X7_9CHLO|mmetsp:Transcript_21744/g.51961  ORF Transcript_21744/g.51961 Transcript_21744/m.51961 type:complete len:383 (-) Transcript_21744:179-1327(-)
MPSFVLAAFLLGFRSLVLANVGSTLPRHAFATLGQNGTSSQVSGALSISSFDSSTTVLGIVTGLEPGQHGFHIHESADFSDGCDSTGGHWNPFNTDHGAPLNSINSKHLGDFGNIQADESGTALVNVSIDEDLLAELFRNESQSTRVFLVHEDPDDLGLGNNNGSALHGNAGPRLKCGVISAFEPIRARAVLDSGPEEHENITGTIEMNSLSPTTLRLTGNISGLEPGSAHGLHIHTGPAEEADTCGPSVTGGHYNPLERNHSSPENPILERHMGDFGNVVADANGIAPVDMEVENVFLWGPYSVVGRSWVLHAGEDDLGLGGASDSLTTGAAGGRIRCGTIRLLDSDAGGGDSNADDSSAKAVSTSAAVAAAFLAVLFLLA